MSTAGGSRELDAFFERHLEPGLKGDLLTLQRLLNEGRFSTGKLRLRLTREAMAPWASALEREAEKLAGRGPLPEHHLEQVEAFLDEFQRLSPGASTARDAQLEAYGWAFGLSGEPLKKLVEDRKSTQLENIHAVAINGASALEDYFAHLGRPQRVEMIKFLMNADSARLPDFVDADLDRYAEAVAPPKPETPDDHRGQAAVKASLEASLLGLVNEKSPIERIPLFESLMTAGVDRLTTHPESMERLFAECLGLAPKSREAALLRAYLDVTPAYEATVTLSFIIAQRCEEGESEDPGAATRALFEAFGIAGKKTGQKASVMNLFGDEVSAATAEFKNRARPMTRVQVMEALEESLTDAEKKQIKRCVRVLGSASLKTAVEVELVDGRRVALLIQPHQSAALISENIELGKAYIARLREEPELDLPVAMLENLVLSLEEELHAEQRFSVEVSRSKRAAAVVEALNHDMAPELDGWKLTVPQPVDGFEVRDELMFVDLAEGRTWDQLTKPEREKAGPLLVSAALKMLFEHGEFDPDRHLGNWLFKLDSMNAGEIQMLDVAELDSFSKSRRPFQSDELFTLSRALQGVEKKDARLLAQLGPQMARPGQPVKDPARLERELAEALKGSDDFSATMVKVLSTWADHGIYLQKKFFLGGFNGLMILMREHYVPEQAFFELIEGHVRSTVKRKLPTVLGQEIRQLWR